MGISRIAILLLCVVSGGCTTSRSLTVQAHRDAPQPAAEPAVFKPAQLGDIPAGRFCRVHSKLPDTLHEGTVVSVSADGIVLSDAAVVSPRSMGLFGNLPFDWSRRMSRGTDVDFPDRVVVQRESIAAVDVYDAEETERLRAGYASWRAKQKRIRLDLVTAQEFPNSG